MKKIFYLAIVILSALSFNSCEDNITDAKDLNYITFELDKSFGIAPNSSLSTDVKVFTASPVSSDMVLDLVVQSNIDSNVFNTATSVTIPANSNEGSFTLEIPDTNLLNGKGGTITFSADAPDGFFVDERQTSVEVGIVLCPDDLTGVYNYTDGNEKTGVNIVQLAPGEYRIAGDNRYGTNYFIDVTYECNFINVTGGRLGQFGFTNSGTGKILPNGDIELIHTAAGLYSGRTMTLRKQ